MSVIQRRMAVFDGQLVDPFTVKASDGIFRIETIAHALSMLCRYNGHVARFYSVAEHSILVERIVWSRIIDHRGFWQLRLCREALVHDIAEAYLGDLIGPFKACAEFDKYAEAEDRLTCELRAWLGLPGDEPEVIRQIDVEIRGTERHWLMPLSHGVTEWKTAPVIDGIVCGTMTPEQAKTAWLARFHELWPNWNDRGAT